MIFVAILYEDGKAIRAFKDSACIYNAYKWAHRHFCLEDLNLPIYKLPDWLEISFHMMTEEQFKEIIK